tara:strand:- start:320 stop:529 length:210 start_codon:yes stop_codon:yes gene_type:complete
MDLQQISIPSNSPTSSPRSVKKNIDTDESSSETMPHKIIEGKSLLNINEQEPLMNSKKGILYYLLDKKY